MDDLELYIEDGFIIVKDNGEIHNIYDHKLEVYDSVEEAAEACRASKGMGYYCVIVPVKRAYWRYKEICNMESPF